MAPAPRWWVLVAITASSAVFGLAGLGLAALTVRQLCDVVSAQVDVYREVPPSTPTGQRAERAWRDLETRIC